MWKLFKIVKFIHQNQLIAAKRTKENKKIENRYGSSVTDKKNRENKPKYDTTKKIIIGHIITSAYVFLY